MSQDKSSICVCQDAVSQREERKSKIPTHCWFLPGPGSVSQVQSSLQRILGQKATKRPPETQAGWLRGHKYSERGSVPGPRIHCSPALWGPPTMQLSITWLGLSASTFGLSLIRRHVLCSEDSRLPRPPSKWKRTQWACHSILRAKDLAPYPRLGSESRCALCLGARDKKRPEPSSSCHRTQCLTLVPLLTSLPSWLSPRAFLRGS